LKKRRFASQGNGGADKGVRRALEDRSNEADGGPEDKAEQRDQGSTVGFSIPCASHSF